jgi:hypothetical protein
MTFKAFAIAALMALAACADHISATDAQLTSARYVAEPPRSITLFTVIATRNGSGAHSGLLVNGSEQVLFDPAGSWYHPALPERGDVHYGVTPKMVAFYIDYHARVTYDVIEQTVNVSPEVAEMVLQRVRTHGAVSDAHCTRAVSEILQGVPGFDPITVSWFPNRLSKEFAEIPGATYKRISDDDADHNHGVLMVQAADAPK